MAWDEKLPGNVGIKAQEPWFVQTADGMARGLYSHYRRALRLFVNGVEQDPATYWLTGPSESEQAPDAARPTAVTYAAASSPPGLTFTRAPAGGDNPHLSADYLARFKAWTTETYEDILDAQRAINHDVTDVRVGGEKARRARDVVYGLITAGDMSSVEALAERGDDGERWWARSALADIEKRHAEEARATLASIRDEWDNLPDAEPVGIVRRP